MHNFMSEGFHKKMKFLREKDSALMWCRWDRRAAWSENRWIPLQNRVAKNLKMKLRNNTIWMFVEHQMFQSVFMILMDNLMYNESVMH